MRKAKFPKRARVRSTTQTSVTVNGRTRSRTTRRTTTVPVKIRRK